jgi:hypothetical protein
VLATLDITGPAAAPLPPVPTRPEPRDLRAETVTARRRLTFTTDVGTGMGSGMSFAIDGR